MNLKFSLFLFCPWGNFGLGFTFYVLVLVLVFYVVTEHLTNCYGGQMKYLFDYQLKNFPLVIYTLLLYFFPINCSYVYNFFCHNRDLSWDDLKSIPKNTFRNLTLLEIMQVENFFIEKNTLMRGEIKEANKKELCAVFQLEFPYLK